MACHTDYLIRYLSFLLQVLLLYHIIFDHMQDLDYLAELVLVQLFSLYPSIIFLFVSSFMRQPFLIFIISLAISYDAIWNSISSCNLIIDHFMNCSPPITLFFFLLILQQEQLLSSFIISLSIIYSQRFFELWLSLKVIFCFASLQYIVSQ